MQKRRHTKMRVNAKRNSWSCYNKRTLLELYHNVFSLEDGERVFLKKSA